jgi:hypothetical protein
MTEVWIERMEANHENIEAMAKHYKRFYRKVPELGQKRNVGLTYSILAAISFKIVSLGTHCKIGNRSIGASMMLRCHSQGLSHTTQACHSEKKKC